MDSYYYFLYFYFLYCFFSRVYIRVFCPLFVASILIGPIIIFEALRYGSLIIDFYHPTRTHLGATFHFPQQVAAGNIRPNSELLTRGREIYYFSTPKSLILRVSEQFLKNFLLFLPPPSPTAINYFDWKVDLLYTFLLALLLLLLHWWTLLRVYLN